MKKRVDWPIEFCEVCKHLGYSPIKDAICVKTGKYLWLNGFRLPSGMKLKHGKKFNFYEYMPEWCPLEDYSVEDQK